MSQDQQAQVLQFASSSSKAVGLCGKVHSFMKANADKAFAAANGAGDILFTSFAAHGLWENISKATEFASIDKGLIAQFVIGVHYLAANIPMGMSGKDKKTEADARDEFAKLKDATWVKKIAIKSGRALDGRKNPVESQSAVSAL